MPALNPRTTTRYCALPFGLTQYIVIFLVLKNGKTVKIEGQVLLIFKIFERSFGLAPARIRMHAILEFLFSKDPIKKYL